jgi:alpha-1,3-rhamnosyl/mannosyltransferase
MPYIYEAVSLTALEAQATGTPVICTNTPGLRETTGGAAILMTKAEVPEMVEAMSRLAGDPALRRELAEKGLAHAQRFSWQRCSAETLAVLEEAAHLSAPLVHVKARGGNCSV